MGGYVSLYKCKLCGKEFIHDAAKNKLEIKIKDVFSLHLMHECKNGDVGNTEFLGWKVHDGEKFGKNV